MRVNAFALSSGVFRAETLSEAVTGYSAVAGYSAVVCLIKVKPVALGSESIRTETLREVRVD